MRFSLICSSARFVPPVYAIFPSITTIFRWSLKFIAILKTGIKEKGEPYFSVQDNGIGMDEDDIPHIFERFFRADTARVRKNGGTGLGLSIAKWIIDGHRGYFSVLSRKGIGTRITIFLPGRYKY